MQGKLAIQRHLFELAFNARLRKIRRSNSRGRVFLFRSRYSFGATELGSMFKLHREDE